MAGPNRQRAVTFGAANNRMDKIAEQLRSRLPDVLTGVLCQ